MVQAHRGRRVAHHRLRHREEGQVRRLGEGGRGPRGQADRDRARPDRGPAVRVQGQGCQRGELFKNWKVIIQFITYIQSCQSLRHYKSQSITV